MDIEGLNTKTSVYQDSTFHNPEFENLVAHNIQTSHESSRKTLNCRIRVFIRVDNFFDGGRVALQRPRGEAN